MLRVGGCVPHDADGLWGHDLVSILIFEHTVLVDPALVSVAQQLWEECVWGLFEGGVVLGGCMSRDERTGHFGL